MVDAAFHVLVMDLLARLIGVGIKVRLSPAAEHACLLPAHCGSADRPLVCPQAFVLLRMPAANGAAARPRSRVLTLVEHCLLVHRSLLTVPVWWTYFDQLALGSLVAAPCTGAQGSPLHPACADATPGSVF